MLVALSGVQGSGKTTVLNGLKNLGYNIIERKTARSILIDWNVKLEEVYADQELCKKFHDELLLRKKQDEAVAVYGSSLNFTERSYADLFTYALVSLGHFNIHSDWLNQYYVDCKELNANYLGVFFLNAPRGRVIENDGVRGTNQHYVKQVNAMVSQTSHEFAYKLVGQFHEPSTPLIEVSREEIDQRVRFVAEHANDLWLTERLHLDNNFYQTMKHPERIEAEKRARQNCVIATSTHPYLGS